MVEGVNRIWRNAKIATMTDNGAAYGAIEGATLAKGATPARGATIVERDGRIAWLGPDADAPEMNANEEIDLDGRWITPGLIDCHTHIVYGGNRAEEFERRLQGATYQEIAKAGGGIASTVTATRAASEEQLLKSALRRLDAMLGEGVTTIEVKSGYGLDTENELKMLRVAASLTEHRDVRILKTFLGAHALPPEANGDSETYINAVCNQQLAAAVDAGAVDAVDVFCEGIGFSLEQTRQVFEAAKKYGLPLKVHAEQLSNLGGSKMAARYGALSCDHLEHIDEQAVAAMGEAGSVAVLLPGAFYFLRESKLPPIDLLRRHGVHMAVATDCNPGSSPLTSLLLAMNMSCTLFRLTPEEALSGVTLHAAQALGLAPETGSLEVGKACDLAIWNIEHPSELSYGIGFNPLYQRVFGGSK